MKSNSRLIFCKKNSNAIRQLSGDSYQFLEKSRIPTYHFQKSLPRLPIPKLEDTCRRYLNAIKPIISSTNFERTSKIVADFQKNEGPALQDALVKHDQANKQTSYISKPWYDIYLRQRTPIAINTNPFMAFAMDPDTRFNDQLTRATNMVISIGRFKRSLDAKILKPEVFHMQPKKSKTPLYENFCRALPQSVSWYGSYFFKAFPLDMSQHPFLFNTTRIPHAEQDIIRQVQGSRHFVVLRYGQFYAVDLFDADGSLLSPASVLASLSKILTAPKPKDASLSQSIGTFTTLARDQWATVRNELIAVSRGNQESMTKLDSAIFALCLDDEGDEDPLKLSRNCLYGNNAARNRWFDKSFSLIVDGSGLASINFEHAWGDGVAVLRLMEDIYADSNKHHFVAPDTKVQTDKATVQKLDFQLTDRLKETLTSAQNDYTRWCHRLDFGTLEYPHITRNIAKQAKLSPDSIIQVAIQAAYYTISGGKRIATYESCSTSAFKHGRTETMRPATEATNHFVEALNRGASNAQLRELIGKCSSVHSELVKEASMGQGFDRHMLGLKVIAAEQLLKIKTPEIFLDRTYQEVTHYVLSTSTLSTSTIIMGGFGPVVNNGYGIGYNVDDKQVGTIVSSYRDQRKAQEFCDALKESLDAIKVMLDSTKR